MQRKIWFYLFIIQAIILVLITVFLIHPFAQSTVKQVDLSEFLNEYENINYLPQAGYIPDAKTAQIIGSAIIDKMTGNSPIRPSGVSVEYDQENRLWAITKGYYYGLFAFGAGGVVVIEQDSGKIIEAYLTK